MSRVVGYRITPRRYAYMATVVEEFLAKALETKSYKLEDIPKGVLAGIVRFFDEALEAVSLRGLFYNDVYTICHKIIVGQGRLVEEKVVYDLVRYRSFFKRRVWSQPVSDTEIKSLQELHLFLNQNGSDRNYKF